MPVELDALDQQLLSLLQANAREGTAELARRLGLARTTVVARIARLEREGVVAGYGVRLASGWQAAPCAPGAHCACCPRPGRRCCKCCRPCPRWKRFRR